MGEKANLIDTPAAAPSVLNAVVDKATGTAGDLGNAAVAGFTGVVTAEVGEGVHKKLHSTPESQHEADDGHEGTSK